MPRFRVAQVWEAAARPILPVVACLACRPCAVPVQCALHVTGGTALGCLPHTSQVVVDDVEAAVEAGLHRARHAKWHSMR